MRWVIVSPLLLIGPLIAEGQSATFRVPSEYSTIQAGIDVAAFGDTVLVAPGTYSDVVVRDVPGLGERTACVIMKDGVVLLSESGAEVTTIDMMGQSGFQPNVILSHGQISDETVMEGFTITGSPSGVTAVLINESGKHTVRACVVRDMDSRGMAIRFTNVDVIDCHFENCVGAPGGALVQLDSRILIRGCTFVNCPSTAVGLQGEPGFDPSSAIIEDCVFIGNLGGAPGGRYS